MKNYKLEFIRGFAAILVFICHLFVSNSKLQGRDFGLISNWGTEAVMAFFILSGLVIAKSCEGRNITSRQFFINRLARLYPLLLISLIFAYSLSYFLLGENINIENIVGNVFLLGTLDAKIYSVPNANIVIWSLSFEMFFYIIFGIILYFKNYKALWVWQVISILLIPLYYCNYNGIMGYIIEHLVFSTPWLLGFYLNKYSKHLNYFNLADVFFFVAILPSVARLKITTEFYCIIKYDLFAIVSLPLFIYANNSNISMKPTKNNYLKYTLMFSVYLLSSFSLIYFSDSRMFAKIIYILLPIILLFAMPFIKHIFKYFQTKLIQFSLYLGSISYGLYIIHFPMLILISNYIKNPLLYLIVGIVCCFGSAHFLEKIIQPKFNSLIKRI